MANMAACALAVALVATPRLVPSCTHEIAAASGASIPMRCHWTFQVEFLLAMATLVVAGALWVVDQLEARRVVALGLVLLGFLMVVVPLPWVVGLCGNPAMACHQTAHWIWLWAGLLAVDGLAIAVSSVVKGSVPVVPDPWDVPAGTHPPAPKGTPSC
jgi:hypothetical protein